MLSSFDFDFQIARSELLSILTRHRHSPHTHSPVEPASHNLKGHLYKTEICLNWIEKQSCPYQDKCQYAHGEHELRPLERHPNFKTKLCQNYARDGSCPYGRRCCFMHQDKQPIHQAIVEDSAFYGPLMTPSELDLSIYLPDHAQRYLPTRAATPLSSAPSTPDLELDSADTSFTSFDTSLSPDLATFAESLQEEERIDSVLKYLGEVLKEVKKSQSVTI